MNTHNCLSTEHSRNSAPGMALTLPLVTQADITRVMGPFCHIVLDNGDEAFYINGHYIDGADAASRSLPAGSCTAYSTGMGAVTSLYVVARPG